MHTEEKTLKKFKKNEMNTDEAISYLEHLDKCDYCLEQLLTSVTENSAASAPDYLKEQILTRASSLDVRAEKSVSETSHRVRLFYEGLHTAAGILMALFLLFCIGKTDYTSFGARQTGVPTQMQRSEISGHLQDFSRNINEGLSRSSEKMNRYLNNITFFITNGGK